MFGKARVKQKTGHIKSKAWLDMLTGETVEKANTRVDEHSHIDYGVYQREVDENGTEMLRRVEWKK